MNNSGFYKKGETQILYAPNIVEGPNYMLTIEDKDNYSYPVDGWIYSSSLDSAISYFANSTNAIQPFDVQPENIKLGLNESDRVAFTQMLVLVKEALDLNLIDNNTIQTIADIDGVKHSVTTLRFRQIMVEYGFYYKNLWDQLN